MKSWQNIQMYKLSYVIYVGTLGKQLCEPQTDKKDTLSATEIAWKGEKETNLRDRGTWVQIRA
jgi:hypothetical protein